MTNEQLVNKIGLALIAAGHALVGTAKFETKQETTTTTTEAKTGAAPKEEKPKRKRRTKAEIEAEKKAKAEAEATTDDDFGGEETNEAEVVEANTAVNVDEDTLKKALVAYAKKEGKEKAFGVLGEYGAKKVVDLDPKHYGAVYEAVAINA